VVAVFDLSHPQLAGGVWGHEESERLLRQVAELALAFFRVDDTVARLGTAEFGVVMTMKNAEDAEPRLAAFREEASRRCRSGQSAVAISVGFCVAEPGAAGTPEQLSLLAEQALRDAKSHERRLARRELERLLLPEPGHEQPR
jgi:diguanylate cyclase (GGDEF)-like protein